MTKLDVNLDDPHEVRMTRVFDAPMRLVIRAMTEPALIMRWLGNSRSPITKCEMDTRVGGRYRYEFRRPDGVTFAMVGEIRELAADRIVMTQAMEGMPGESVVTTTYREHAGKTTMVTVVRFPSREIRDMVAATGMTDGAGESYDNLDALVQRL